MLKKIFILSLALSSQLAIATSITTANNSIYINALGALSKGVFDANFTRYQSGVLTEKSSFNDKYNKTYTSISVGADSKNSSLPFSHEVGIARFWSSKNFLTSGSQWGESNQYDIFYNFMPSYKLNSLLTFKAILGIHLGSFSYFKNSATSTSYNGNKSAFGFGIGAAMDYKIKNNIVVGATVARIQFKEQTISGVNSAGTVIDSSALTPNYNIFGAHIKYYIS